MELSPDQERDIIQQFDKKLRAIARSFCRGKSASEEDCLQELYIVFLKHIRQAKTLEEIAYLPMMDLKNAMCKQVLRGLPVSVPLRTADFEKRIATIRAAGSAEDVSISWTDAGYPEAEERISFELLLRNLSEKDRATIGAMLTAGTMAGAARALGLSKATISRHLQRIKGIYLTGRYNAPEA